MLRTNTSAERLIELMLIQFVRDATEGERLTPDLQIKHPDLLLWYDGPASCCDEKVLMALLTQLLSLCWLHM